jgi:hypothetical protein
VKKRRVEAIDYLLLLLVWAIVLATCTLLVISLPPLLHTLRLTLSLKCPIEWWRFCSRSFFIILFFLIALVAGTWSIGKAIVHVSTLLRRDFRPLRAPN